MGAVVKEGRKEEKGAADYMSLTTPVSRLYCWYTFACPVVPHTPLVPALLLHETKRISDDNIAVLILP